MVTGLNRKKLNKKNILILCICLLICSGIVYQVYNAYAKYYAARYNKGIAVASNLYFNSDKLLKNTGITDIDVLLADKDFVNDISVITDSWAGNSTLMSFAIRNYDNNILYNESGLDIEYEIWFVMLDEPVGAEYYIRDAQDNSYQLSNAGDRKSFNGVVKGGSLDYDRYGIEIRRMSSGETEYESSRVLVMAYPTNPDYIKKDKDDDTQEYRLLGVFEAYPRDVKISIDEAKFKVQTQESPINYAGNWKAAVEDLSAYIYNIKTKGDVVVEQNSSNAQQAIVSWDNRYLNIDIYDEYYLAAVEHDSIYGSDEPLEGEERYLIRDDSGKLNAIIIDVLPYMSIDMTFYKAEGFNDMLKTQSGTSGKEWFEGLVNVRMYGEETG